MQPATPTLLLNNNQTTVSYTHLDVYKRQDQGCTKCNRYNMDDSCYILSKVDDTYVCTGFIAKFRTLIDLSLIHISPVTLMKKSTGSANFFL